MAFATADLYDYCSTNGLTVGVCEVQFRTLGGRRAFHGPIVTVRCEDDNPLVRKALESAGEGRVLVVDGRASLRTALLGDNIARLAISNGWAGIVVNGAVRDAAVLAGLDIGIKALGTTPRKSGKVGAGESGLPVTFGAMTFTPGHWLYADDDGIVVSPTKLAAS